jgi:hypothetical protein
MNLQFDFSVFYDYLDTLTKSINNLSTSATNWLNDKVDYVSDNPALNWVNDNIIDKYVD